MSQSQLNDRMNARLAETAKGRRVAQEEAAEPKPNPIRDQAMNDSRIRVRDTNERERMEEAWGPRLDAMATDERQQLARRVLTPFLYEYWTRNPTAAIVREDLLTALAFEQSHGREFE